MNHDNATGGNWHVACDSYGKVRHSKKACVFTTVRGLSGGDLIVTVAARIPCWTDAKLIAAAKEMLSALEGLNHMGGDKRGGYCICPVHNGTAPHAEHSSNCQDARYAIAKAHGRVYADGELLPDAFKAAS